MTPRTSDIESAVSILLTPGGLDLDALDTGLGYALGAGIDYADLYFQRTWQEGWVLEDGEVKEASYNIDGGVGVRSLAGEKTGVCVLQSNHRRCVDGHRANGGWYRSQRKTVTRSESNAGQRRRALFRNRSACRVISGRKGRDVERGRSHSASRRSQYQPSERVALWHLRSRVGARQRRHPCRRYSPPSCVSTSV